MNGQIDFDCHDFFDNDTLCILEISLANRDAGNRNYKWLLINKLNLSVKPMSLKNRDGSSSVQERFFDLGFLKYDAASGVFIEAVAQDVHRLEHKGCEEIPSDYISAIKQYLRTDLVEQGGLN